MLLSSAGAKVALVSTSPPENVADCSCRGGAALSNTLGPATFSKSMVTTWAARLDVKPSGSRNHPRHRAARMVALLDGQAVAHIASDRRHQVIDSSLSAREISDPAPRRAKRAPLRQPCISAYDQHQHRVKLSRVYEYCKYKP